MVALGWSKAQASENQTAFDPNSTVARVVANAAAPASPTATMKLIGSYATVAHLLDQMAELPGMAGAMLSFDDFRTGIDQFGQHIQPLMACRAGRVGAGTAA
jgi:pyrimidine oxygenase